MTAGPSCLRSKPSVACSCNRKSSAAQPQAAAARSDPRRDRSFKSFLIVFSAHPSGDICAQAPIYGRLLVPRPHLPISGLLTCSQKGKKQCFSKQSWKTRAELLTSSCSLLTEKLPRVPFDPHLNYSRKPKATGAGAHPAKVHSLLGIPPRGVYPAKVVPWP
jgi:hypothetical protein